VYNFVGDLLMGHSVGPVMTGLRRWRPEGVPILWDPLVVAHTTVASVVAIVIETGIGTISIRIGV
jgi:hypothetical protein